MIIPISLPVGMTDIQLSFRDNAGTRGDAQGAVPVILWTGAFVAATYVLEVTLKSIGRAMMGLKATDTAAAKPTMYESEWIIVP